jgi:hypothetical protein
VKPTSQVKTNEVHRMRTANTFPKCTHPKRNRPKQNQIQQDKRELTDQTKKGNKIRRTSQARHQIHVTKLSKHHGKS